MQNTTPTVNNFYTTTDLALAAVLSLWHPLHSIDKTNPRQSIFRFEPNTELGELVAAYWRGELQVEPQSFFNQLRIIKARLYAKE